MRKSLLYISLGILIILGMLHYAGQIFYFYWDIRWYDNLAHFLGGLSIGFLCLWVWFVSGLFGSHTPSKKDTFLVSIISAMTIGLGWEFFEYAYGIAAPIGSYSLDTFHDLFADFVGASVAGIVAAKKHFYE